MNTDQTPQQTRVSRITIGRLHNLGDYEHIRYEVAVDVAPGDNPAEIIANLETALTDIQAESGIEGWRLHRAQQTLAKPESQLDALERESLETYREYVRKDEEAQARRQSARETLAKLGMTSQYKDAKRDWDDQD